MTSGHARIRVRLLAPALLTAALLGAGCGHDSTSAATDAKTDGPAALAPCANVPGIPTARCGTLQVPLDRANPSAATTTVAFALIPRRNASTPSAGTLAFNPGGPGEPTIDHAADLTKMFAPLLDRRDLLLIDPRGTGRSAALRCSAEARPKLADVFATPADGLETIGACGRELGALVGQYGTAAVADDFDAVRASLGVDRLDLWGNSYGTYLMPVYAARHPDHVRSMVLSGAYPIDFDPWGRDRADGMRRGIRLMCARTRSCRGDAVLRDLAALATRLRHGPVTFTVPVGSQRFRARLDENALAALAYGGGNAYVLGQLPAIAASGRIGDLAPMRRVVENGLLAQSYGVIQHVPRTESLAQALSTECHDFPRAFSLSESPVARHAAYERARAAIDPDAFFPFSASAWTSAGFEAAATCIEWPNDPTGARPIAPGTPMPDVPVLVISGDLDANTPSSAGRQVAGQFAHATFAEIPDAGHVPTDASPCALKLGVRFVATTSAAGDACADTGAPPPVTPRAPLRAADLAAVKAATATVAQRRALAVVVATATDLQQQAELVTAFKRAHALRGGWYVGDGKRVRLASARVVRDATVSGELAVTKTQITGALRLTGRGTPHGRLSVRLTGTGASAATGTLDGRPVHLTFRVGG
jgi:pimeloyl-ACP methyl ester carboxylesterase